MIWNFSKKIQHCLLFCPEILCRMGIMLYFFAVFIEICNINQFQSGQSGDNLDLRLAARCCCLIFRLHQKKPTTGVEQCRIYPECWLFAVYRENEITKNRKTVTYFILTWTKSQHRQVSTRKIGPHQRKCWLFMPYIENQPTQLIVFRLHCFFCSLSHRSRPPGFKFLRFYAHTTKPGMSTTSPVRWCAMRDLNPHGRPLDPKSSASAKSANRACA